ncbi:MAG: two-component sensor histidine kinase [Lachnospiraceae bacterium]|nr:two-component sensor histidine kinase [Lachnospiraceae bacterium]
MEKLKKVYGLRSLRFRIFVIMLAVGMIPGALMRYSIVENYMDRAVDVRIATVQNQLKILANHLIYYGYLQSSTSESINAELEMLSSLYDGRVLIIGGNFKVVKDTYDISEGRIVISEEVLRCFKGETISRYSPGTGDANGYMEIVIPITETVKTIVDSQEKEEVVVRGVMLTSISDESITATTDVLRRNAMILMVLVDLVIIALAMVLCNVMTRPFERITQAIRDVKEGYSDEAISVPDYAETVHIVDAFNQLQRRMKVLDDSRQEFVANVSHELKTPMASIKVLADSLLAQPDAPAQLYREFMEDIATEIDRENRIITDLLTLVKMDKKAADMNIAPVNMNDLTELILKRLRPIARKRDVEVVFESARNVTAEVDEVKMTLILSNLVENAIKYNKEHGSVKVTLDADHQNFTIVVTDSGIGMPEEALAHIYERFYRVDKSHSREIGGTGLGLAITRSAVLMHRGSISVVSREGEGTSFTVKIPLIYII